MGGAPVAGGGNRAWHEAAARSLGPGSTRVPVPPSFHGHDLEHWPLQHTLVFGALEAVVPSARAHLRQFLGRWGTAELGQDAAVVLSELVTNAIAASAALWPAEASVLVWLGSDGDRVLVVVGDASPRPPMRLTLEPDAEGGRGLALVEALSSRWGWHPASIAGLLKVVWAEWRLPAGAGPLSGISATGPASCTTKTCSSAASTTAWASPAQRPGGTGRPARSTSTSAS